METLKESGPLDLPERLEGMKEGIDFYLKALRNPETSGNSRTEYIRSFNEFLQKKNGYEIKLIVEDRDDIIIGEALGSPLANLSLVGIDNDFISNRGLLAFADSDNRLYRLPLLALPEKYDTEIFEK